MTTNPYIPGIAELAYYDPLDLARSDVPPIPKAMRVPDLGRNEPAIVRFTKGRAIPSSLWI